MEDNPKNNEDVHSISTEIQNKSAVAESAESAASQDKASESTESESSDPTAPTTETTSVATPSAPIDQLSPVLAQKKGLSKKSKIIFAIVGTVIIAFSGAAAFFVIRDLNKPTTNKTNKTNAVNTTEVDSNTTPIDEEKNTEVPTTVYHVKSWDYRETSLDSRIKLPNKDVAGTIYDKYKFYNIAFLDNGASLMVLKTDEFVASAFAKESAYFIVTGDKVELAKNVSNITVDAGSFGVSVTEADIPELNPTESISFNGQIFSSDDKWGSDTGVNDYGKDYIVKLLTTTKLGKFYEISSVNSQAPGYKMRAYDLETPDTRTHRYKLDSAKISNDDSTLKVNWSNASSKNAVFMNPMHGCARGYYASDTLLNFAPDISSAEQVGTTASSEKPVYKLTTDNFVKTMYDEYANGRENDKLSLEDYQTKLTHVIFQDGLGSWVLLQNSSYGTMGECGKPVIYLYPTKTTSVNVAVGAEITVSDPAYPTGGWRNVIAQPNGSLSYGGKKYNSLFWEGLGYGSYPDTNSIGTIVSQDKLLSTVRSQLAAQGLNTKEKNDFMAYWADKLPKTPYVKLTWLTMEQMNELAPLRITPKPDTVIRAFLEAKAVDGPAPLLKQSFSAPVRNGFTVVEWGGLISGKRL